MTAREAWLVTIILTIMLLLALTVAGVVSEWLAPAVATEIGQAWNQAPK